MLRLGNLPICGFDLSGCIGLLWKVKAGHNAGNVVGDSDMTVTETDQHTDDESFAEGLRRTLALDNRGPIRYDEIGAVHPDILDAYWRYGFYVFEGVVGTEELEELRADIDSVLERAPYPTRDSAVDRFGRPALGLDMAVRPWRMATPFSDPVGGTKKNNGRHPVKMNEPAPPADAPAEVPYLVSSGVELSEAFLRVTGHPDLLRVAEAINGPDFTPFTDVLFVKEPGLGPSVAWHQDGHRGSG